MTENKREYLQSEDIRPAILPPEAQSLVLPPARPDDLRRKRVADWLFGGSGEHHHDMAAARGQALQPEVGEFIVVIH